MADGRYRRENAFWTSRALTEMVARAPEAERGRLTARMEKLAKTYAELSVIYQALKGTADIPLS